MRRLLFLLIAGGSAPVMAASFPCDKAQSRVEKAICADAELSQLDEYLARYYGGARAALGSGASCLAADQRRWLSDVRNACADTMCLKNAYRGRLGELHPLQPGATSLRNLELPVVPSLVWIIPPAQDQVAAPPKPKAPPLEVRGELLDDIANGDGFVLRGAQGATLLVMLMFIDEATGQRLTVLSKLPNVSYLARGSAA
ncbi:MAG TPA: lysozyme inhibitor LprI family protein, partial [Burkholderiales bacterium]|nr:lysozyme inhibitor LprI family protein [Burkholderiales bacterium]